MRRVTVHADVTKVRDRLDRAQAGTWDALVAWKPRLLEDPTAGTFIKPTLWPRRFRALPNLFKIDLPRGWRALYTVATVPGGE